MSTVAKLLNKYLASIYDTDHEVYKSLVADVDGVPAGAILKPTDFNNGAIAGMLEWERQLALSLLAQFNLLTAEGDFLELMVHKHIGIVRFEGETDVDYAQRVQDYIIAQKVSPATIIFYTRPFSTPGEPELLDASEDVAFADLSFSDVYTLFQNEAAGPEFDYWVFPALTTSLGSGAYFFILRLENTPSSDIAKVIDLVNRWIAAGIEYEIQIVAV